MKERPILFSGPLVRAILDGTKTQTRRPVRDQPHKPVKEWWTSPGGGWWWRHGLAQQGGFKCPYGQAGDRLWCRETWAVAPELNKVKPSDLDPRWTEHPEGGPHVATLAKYREQFSNWDPWPKTKWRPSIHMPRWASRITLEVTDVRVERLQDISEEDARAEGAPPSDVALTWARSWFKDSWDGIYGKREGLAWTDSPWVWVVDFKRVAP